MPPKKQAPTKKKISKKRVRASAPVPALEIEPICVSSDTPLEIEEQIFVTHIPEKPVIVERHFVHIRQTVFLSVGFMVLFTSFLFVSTKMKAQENSASVSAVVAATPFNTRPPKQPSWWEKIDPYTKLYFGTGAVGALVVGFGALTLLPKKKHTI